MRWSWEFGRIAGIRLRVHVTLVLLLAGVAGAHLAGGHGALSAAQGVLFTAAVFGAIVLHELGHALMARQLGVTTRDITLFPLGGIARLDRMPENPWEQLMIALAGPAVSFALAAASHVVLRLAGAARGDDLLSTGSYLQSFVAVNIAIAVFNLIPAFPLDGGRALRALLALRLPPARATRIAATIGRGFAVLFGLAGLFVNPLLLLMAAFIWVAAGAEADAAEIHGAVGDATVRSAMSARFDSLAPGEPLQHAADLVFEGHAGDFVVSEEGRLVGVLTHADLLRGMARSPEPARATVREAMQVDVEAVDAAEPLDRALLRLRSGDHLLPVVSDGRLLGVLTTDGALAAVVMGAAARATLVLIVALAAGLGAGGCASAPSAPAPDVRIVLRGETAPPLEQVAQVDTTVDRAGVHVTPPLDRARVMVEALTRAAGGDVAVLTEETDVVEKVEWGAAHMFLGARRYHWIIGRTRPPEPDVSP